MTAALVEGAGRELGAIYAPEDGERLDARIAALTDSRLHARAAASDLVAALPGLLAALGWRAGAGPLLDLLPDAGHGFGLGELCRVLRRAGYQPTVRRLRRLAAGETALPCLVVPPASPAVVALEARGPRLLIYDPAAAGMRLVAADAYQRVQVVEARPRGAGEAPSEGWLRRRLARLRPVAWLALALVLAANLLSLGVPLFVMAVFDLAVGYATTGVLPLLVAGIAGILAFELVLRWLRRELLIRTGAELSHALSTAVFGKLLSLPLDRVEGAGTRAQIARMKDIDQMRGAVGGPLALAVLELPFVALALLVVGLLAGSVVWVPLAALLVSVAVGLPLTAWVNGCQAAASRAVGRRQDLALEVVRDMRALRVASAADRWLDRYRHLSRDAAEHGAGAAFATGALSIFGHALGTLTALGIIAAGAWAVASGSLSGGGLIAAMMLSWRLLSAMQRGLEALVRVRALAASARAIESLMAIESEGSSRSRGAPWREIHGAVAFQGVSFRYAGGAGPALANVNFAVEPGELVALEGADGAGKTTLLEIVAGLREPQVGRVLVDGQDLRQFDPAVLRAQISYLPHTPPLFAGTLRDNLAIVSPGASDGAMWQSLELAGVADQVRALPRQLDTGLDGVAAGPVHASLVTRLALARAWLKRAPIVILDEPVSCLDFEGEFAFVAALERLRGRSTVFLASHRPSHHRAADKVLRLDRGRVRCLGRDAVLAALGGSAP